MHKGNDSATLTLTTEAVKPVQDLGSGQWAESGISDRELSPYQNWHINPCTYHSEAVYLYLNLSHLFLSSHRLSAEPFIPN